MSRAEKIAIHAYNARSPLLTIPTELLELIAVNTATLAPNLGPPSALVPLLSVCKGVHERLGWGRNWGFWARIGRAKFTPCAEADYVPYDGYPYEVPDPDLEQHVQTQPRPPLIRAAHTLRARCAALAIIRRGDPLAPGAARAIKIAYGMLVEDDWDGEPMDFSLLDHALGRTALLSRRKEENWCGRRGKNRRQLTWAGARAFAMRYVRERLYLGRWGETDLSFGDRASMRREQEEEWRPEWAHPAWRAGWPRDAEDCAAALWVLWFFEGEETLRAESEPLRRHLMSLLLPFVVAPFRYASSLAPPHHYSVPLLPAVYASSSALLNNAQGGRGEITVPTNHGAYPIYALGAPRRPEAIPDAAWAPVRVAHGAPSPAAGRQGQAHGQALHLRQHAHAHGHSGALQVSPRTAHPRAPSRPHHLRSRLLCGPPARLLFFARMQAGARMGVPPHLPRDRAEATAQWIASGGIGPAPVGPTQEDILEKNARPVVRFERQLPGYNSVSTNADVDAILAVDPREDTAREGGDADERWAPHRWRARLCHGYGAGAISPGSGPGPSRALRAAGNGNTGSGLGGASPGRIGRVYTLGSLVGSWAGTMLMPSEPPYNALVASQGGVLPAAGLARDDFVAAARPLYMRIREHRSYHPAPPVPPPRPDSTTADEGLHAGWLPAGARVVDVGGGQVEVRVPADANAARHGGARAGASVYTYHTPLDARAPAGAHPAHDVETCPGCVRERERARRRRGGASAGVSVSASFQGRGEEGEEEAVSESDAAAWPEWDAPVWAAHRFDGEGWEGMGMCDGVQDVLFTGETDPRHGMAWHHYEFAGRVRPWDGLIGLVMRPRDRTLGLATYFISGHLVGRDTFEGTWQMAAQDVLAPSWGGSVCLARGEE